MWMLNFPFPYESAEVAEAYSKTAQSLLAAIRCESGDQAKSTKEFLDALARMKKLLSSDDYKYFSFQCWQEGVARYAELKVAEIATERNQPGAEFLALKDYRTFREVADSIHAGILTQLSNPSLSGLKRITFYSFGAGVALLLDKTQPGWKRKYFRNKFSLENIFLK